MSDEAKAEELREDRDAHVYLLERSRRHEAWTVCGWGIASLVLMSKAVAYVQASGLIGMDLAVLNLLASSTPIGLWFAIPKAFRRRHWRRRRAIRSARRRLRSIEDQLRPIEARLRYRAHRGDV